MKTAFIGAGNMATAIIGGMLGSGVVQAQNIFVSDPDLSKQNAMRELGVTVCKSSGEAAEAADYVFLCVKPQIYEIALGQIKDSVSHHIEAVIISAWTKHTANLSAENILH